MSKVNMPSKKEEVELKDETIEEIVGQDQVSEPDETVVPDNSEKEDSKKDTKPKKGIVYNCVLLNVRSTPETDASILKTIPKGTKVEIDEMEGNDLFYSIKTTDITTGYCRKEFIKVY